MKLLVCTQAVDATDSNLGFFVEWLRLFAKDCERVEVITLREGSHDLPGTVHVHVLPAGKVARARRFLALITGLRGEYDAVFVHMNPEYLVLGGPLWRVWGKPTGLWYAHKSVTPKLRLATLFANHIFTVASTSFRIATRKKRVMGHGIDLGVTRSDRTVSADGVLRLMTAGRISASKHLLEMLDVLDLLHIRGIRFALTIAGLPLTQLDREYQDKLNASIESKPYASAISFLGAVPHIEMGELLARTDVALNFASTGNMDKSGLEALAAGVPLVTTNESFGALGKHEGLELVERGDAAAFADAIVRASGENTGSIADIVRREHSLASLIPRILKILAHA